MRHDARWLSGAVGTRPGLPIAVLAIVAVILAGACDPNAKVTPTPPPTVAPTVTPTPTPTPVDVAAEFIKIIGSPAFSARAEIGGTVSFGTTTGALSGNAIFAGPGSSLTMKVDTAGTTQQTQSISIGTKRWSRALPGPWLAEPDAGLSQPSLSGSLGAIASVEDLGTVPRDGRPLHHLQPKGGGQISPASVGFAVEGATDAAFGMDFFTTDDGTPAVMGIDGSWTQTAGRVAVPVKLQLEFTLSEVGTIQTVSPPDDVWVRYTSKTFGYTMAHPADWTVGPSKTQDAYAINGQPYVYVAPQKLAEGLSVDDFVASLRDFYKDDFGQPTSQVAATLGGQPGQRLVFEFRNDEGQDVTFVDDVTVRGRTGWEVFLVTAGGAEDIPIFDAFAASFAFTD